MKTNFETLTVQQLFLYYSQILEEMRTRKIVRSTNNPVADYSEWLVAETLGLTLVPNSTKGYDAFDTSGLKYQIKGRRYTHHHKSLQLGAIRNLDNHDFDFLIAVIFNELFEVQKVLKIPHEVIENYANFRQHVNAHILILRGGILSDVKVEDITHLFSKQFS
jgi:hypothetical protein